MKAGGGRAKGHAFERWVANRFRPWWPNARRGLQGRDGRDVPDVVGAGPWWIECKRGRRPNIWKAMAQAMAAKDDGAIPVVISKADHGPVLVTLLLDDWLGGDSFLGLGPG